MNILKCIVLHTVPTWMRYSINDVSYDLQIE